MRIRRVDAKGDMVFGRGQNDYWVDAPEGVALHILYRLELFKGEWFANTADGTPWMTQVLGERTQSTRDTVVRSRVLTTPHVTEMPQYGSQFDPNTRSFTAAMIVNTEYGAAALGVARLAGGLPEGAIPLDAVATTSLGIIGGATPVRAVPADLQAGPATNITEFQIIRMDAGTIPA